LKGIVIATGFEHGVTDVPTVTAQVAVNDPSWVVTVIVALPTATPVTSPAVLTVAIVALLEAKVMVLFVAFEGVMVAVNCADADRKSVV
jgi:hypothetical protein